MTDQSAAEPRALEILESAKIIFASKGFDGASMLDLAQAAGMSAGNFYRYFPSKNAIIEAIIERELATMRAEFAEVIQSPDPLATFRDLVRRHLETINETHGPIWCEIEAAAARRPEAAALLGRMEAAIIDNLVAVFARIGDMPQAEAALRFSAHARLVVMLVQGVSMHSAAYGGAPKQTPDRALGALVSRVIEGMLAEVAAARTTLEDAAHAT